MSRIKTYYIKFYVLVYTLYAFFDKGIAYSYLAEILLLFGLVLLIKDFRNFEIIWNKPMKLLVFFLAITFIYILKNIGAYPILDIIRDSFMFNYALFVFILFMFKNDIEEFKEKLFSIYKWFPIAACISFLLLSYVPFFETFKVFGNFPLLLYKLGDMSVQLLISSLLMINGYIKIPKRFAILNSIITIYMFLVIAAFTRAGMVVFMMGICLFFLFTKSKELKALMAQYLKYAPILGVIAVVFYMSTKMQENFEGRKVGFDQLKDNVVSIVADRDDGSLSSNKAWRLIWWGKIVDDIFSSKHFFVGRGLGMSMSEVDQIETEEENLRSPHNFHLNVLARFGVPFFLLWMYWIYILLIKIRDKVISQFNFTLLIILFAFLLNSSFDVYLEGPMGAFPFWTFVGIYFISAFFPPSKNIKEIAIA